MPFIGQWRYNFYSHTAWHSSFIYPVYFAVKCSIPTGSTSSCIILSLLWFSSDLRLSVCLYCTSNWPCVQPFKTYSWYFTMSSDAHNPVVQSVSLLVYKSVEYASIFQQSQNMLNNCIWTIQVTDHGARNFHWEGWALITGVGIMYYNVCSQGQILTQFNIHWPTCFIISTTTVFVIVLLHLDRLALKYLKCQLSYAIEAV
jgi:hypothetical protein